MKTITAYRGVMLLLAIFVLFPSMALAAPITLSFSGSTGAGLVNGSFTYETVQTPTATNVRGLLDNAVYSLSSWNMTAESNVEGLSTTTFSPSNGRVEFCQGKCIFGSGSQWHTLLTFTTDFTKLQLGFLLGDSTPLVSPPASFAEWGTFSTNASQYRSTVLIPVGTSDGFPTFFSPLALATGGSLSVPLPSTGMLCMLLPAMLFLHYLSRRKLTG
jgi:hypothetical protein